MMSRILYNFSCHIKSVTSSAFHYQGKIFKSMQDLENLIYPFYFPWIRLQQSSSRWAFPSLIRQLRFIREAVARIVAGTKYRETDRALKWSGWIFTLAHQHGESTKYETYVIPFCCEPFQPHQLLENPS